MNIKFFSALVACFLWCGSFWAQQYFRLLEVIDRPYEKKIAHFANDDIVIGGSPIVGKTADQNGGLNLTRIDKCGGVRWALNYQWKNNYMVLKDLKVNDKGDIIVYGSTYEGTAEYIFLLKLSGKGVVRNFRVLHPGTVDHFTYNVDIQGNQLLAYGLILDWNTPKRGFIAILDDDFNFQWAKAFEPFESLGKAIFTSDNGFLCRSGIYHIKLNKQGNLEWANSFVAPAGLGLQPVAGPLEVSDGYIFEATYDNYAFFYKINNKGTLLWQSVQFPSDGVPADMTLLPDGNIFATYNAPGIDENYPSQLLLSPKGIISGQQRLMVPQTLQTTSLHHTVHDNRIVNIIGNSDIRLQASKPSGFLLQFFLDEFAGKCFEWKRESSVETYKQIFHFEPLTLDFFQASFKNISAQITKVDWSANFQEGCNLTTKKLIRTDTLLHCGENWLVTLPSRDFEWEDEVPDNPRMLESPGIYRAFNNDCITPLTYEYHLERIPCQCNVYIPNAFSPNNDGQNDRLELFTNCDLQQLQMNIYDRWGNQVFSSTSDAGWDGTFRQEPVEPGLYVAVIRYQLLNESNESETGSLVQNIQVIR